MKKRDPYDLTREEDLALKALLRLVKRWPESLGLLVFGGAMGATMCVALLDKNGDIATNRNGTTDQDYLLDTVRIPVALDI